MKNQRPFTQEELNSLFVVIDLSEGEEKPLFLKWDEENKYAYADEGFEDCSFYSHEEAHKIALENNELEGGNFNIIKPISDYDLSDWDIADVE